jgi:hypothetical protein
VNFLSSLDKKDAELFQTLCRYCWFVGNLTPLPLVFDVKNKIYNKNGMLPAIYTECSEAKRRINGRVELIVRLFIILNMYFPLLFNIFIKAGNSR